MVFLIHMLKGKKIILGITGSIAAYKSVYLLRQLVRAGAEVQVILTPAAKDFVTELTLSTLSRRPVLTDLFDEQSWSNHVMLGRWADLLLIAPVSCNTLAKMAQGQCDNLLLAVWLSATCPVVLAPAMDEDMWKHPATKKNLQTLTGFGNRILPVEAGELASGLTGEGRMAEPETITDFLENQFFSSGPLKGKKALVSAGPTYEAIDPVRFIGNRSSGKMGISLARELHNRGAEVTLVLGPVTTSSDTTGLRVIKVESAAEMFRVCMDEFSDSDITVMAAAVADYTPAAPVAEKIKKADPSLQLDLVKTEDILAAMGTRKKENQVLVGFALETENEEQHAREKLQKKNADMLVLNSLRDSGAGFGKDTNKVTIFTRDGQKWPFETKQKETVAADIIDTIIRLYYA